VDKLRPMDFILQALKESTKENVIERFSFFGKQIENLFEE
jgi:hypothetical protein